MGVSDLRALAPIEEVELHEYSGEVFAVDAHHWLFRYITVQVRYMDEEYYTTSEGKEVPNLIGMLRGLPTLLNEDIVPLMVFDGAPEELKYGEIEQRRKSKREAKEKMESAREAGDVQAARKYKAQSQSLTPVVQETSRKLLDLLGVPYAEANGAGEGYAARLAADPENSITASLTGDYDALMFGSPRTLRPFSGDSGVEQIHLESMLNELELTQQQLVDAGILMGTDYNAGVSGIGPKRAVKFLSGGRDAVEIAEDWDAETLTREKIQSIRDIFLTPPDGELVRGTSLDEPDFNAAQEFLVEEWEIPQDTVSKNFERFNNYE